MPPQGILLIAAYLPKAWEVRFIDENIAPAEEADLRWADAVFISGMHIQRRHIDASTPVQAAPSPSRCSPRSRSGKISLTNFLTQF